MLLPCALAQGQGVVFSTTEWDFGTIQEKDGAIVHDFLFRNSSAKPVRLGSASLSCSCVQASYSHEEVLPGGTGTVTVRFSPEGAVGAALSYVDLYSSEGKHLSRLNVSADVVPVNLSLEERFRTVLDAKLRAHKGNVAFGYVYKDSSPVREIYLANVTDQAVQLRIEAPSPLKVEAPAIIPPQEVATLTIQIAPSAPYHTYRGELRFFVDGAPARASLPVSAIFMGDRLSSGASLWTLPSEVKMKKGKGSIELGNSGGEELEILGVEMPDGVSADIAPGQTIPPGGKKSIKVSGKTPRFSIHIFTNDPIRPYKELRFITQ